MAQGDVEGRGNRWPFHSAHFWCGLLGGAGIGLLLGAALVELGLLTLSNMAWVSVLGIVLFSAGAIVAACVKRPLTNGCS